MSRRERDKGARGQREALDLLAERGYTVVETNSGRASEDLFALDPVGHAVAVEVKYHEATRWQDFRRQAREQARARRVSWLLMCRLPGHPHTFVVEGAEIAPVVWRGNGAPRESAREARHETHGGRP